jgi:ABC-type branched-subunit amino acid transport system substrate-binding protein
MSIAVVGPLTPSSKAFGTAHLQGVTLAVEEYNQQNAGSGREIHLRVFDDEATPAKSASVVESLVNSDAVAVLGPANSSATAAVIELLQSQRLAIPVISSLSSATKLTENLKTPYFLRANVSDRKRLSTLLDLVFNDDSLKPRRLIAFYERADAFGEGMLQDAKTWLKTHNSAFLEHSFLAVAYPRDLSQSEAAQLIADANTQGYGAKQDGVLLLGIAQDAITFIDVLRKKNVQSRIYFNEPDHLVFKSAADRGVQIAGVHILSVYWPQNATVNSFKSSFQKKFNEEPSFSAALAYDAARTVLSAIDGAYVEGLRSKDVSAFRDRIQTSLRKGVELSDYVLGGNHKFDNHEYKHLDFQGLQYTSRGKLIPWDQDPVESPTIQITGQEKPIVPPPLYNFLLVAFFAFIGSTIREVTRKPPENAWRFLARLFSPISLIVDPAISLIVFGCIFLITILTKRTLLEIGGDALLIYTVASVALGAVSGFLGIRALFAVIKHLGININETELVGQVGQDAGALKAPGPDGSRPI